MGYKFIFIFMGIPFTIQMMMVLKMKIAYFWSCGQPNKIRECETYFMMHEKPCHPTNKIDLQVHKGVFMAK
jgi:hypothetical protein